MESSSYHQVNYIHLGLVKTTIFPVIIKLFFAGKGPFPGIIDLYTFGGGLSEPRASLLANKGYVVLALAYYGYQDLPKKPKMLDLEYFEAAVTYMRVHPEVGITIHSGE